MEEGQSCCLHPRPSLGFTLNPLPVPGHPLEIVTFRPLFLPFQHLNLSPLSRGMSLPD